MAWLGTPIHELGHALFCVIFRHRITKIEFFKPDPVSGTLGYVEHKWNRHNLWQVLGNFFIGVGPVILGCAVLFAVSRPKSAKRSPLPKVVLGSPSTI